MPALKPDLRALPSLRSREALEVPQAQVPDREGWPVTEEPTNSNTPKVLGWTKAAVPYPDIAARLQPPLPEGGADSMDTEDAPTPAPPSKLEKMRQAHQVLGEAGLLDMSQDVQDHIKGRDTDSAGPTLQRQFSLLEGHLTTCRANVESANSKSSGVARTGRGCGKKELQLREQEAEAADVAKQNVMALLAEKEHITSNHSQQPPPATLLEHCITDLASTLKLDPAVIADKKQ